MEKYKVEKVQTIDEADTYRKYVVLAEVLLPVLWVSPLAEALEFD
jgi:hypothetical protein